MVDTRPRLLPAYVEPCYSVEITSQDAEATMAHMWATLPAAGMSTPTLVAPFWVRGRVYSPSGARWVHLNIELYRTPADRLVLEVQRLRGEGLILAQFYWRWMELLAEEIDLELAPRAWVTMPSHMEGPWGAVGELKAESSELLKPLLELLSSPFTEIQEDALATVVDLSHLPVNREVLLAQGTRAKILQLQPSSPELRRLITKALEYLK